MDVTIHPLKTGLKGTVQAISSKSDVHRALILAALADRETVISCNLLSQDMEATARCLRALGATIQYDAENSRFLVQPIAQAACQMKAAGGAASEPVASESLDQEAWRKGAAGETSAEEEPAVLLDCGESGSTLRFLLPVAAALGRRVTFTGSGRLPERPVGVLLEELQRHGVKASDDRLPLTLSGRLQAGNYTLPGNVSSQFVTGLLLAFPLLKGPALLRLSSPLESKDYVEVTRAAMAQFGCAVQETDWGYRWGAAGQGAAGAAAEIRRTAAYRSPGFYETDGDWSNAAFFLCARALSERFSETLSENRSADASAGAEASGSARCAAEGAHGIQVSGLRADSPQADRRILSVLREAEVKGCFCFDASQAPDLVPVLAAFAAFLPGTSDIAHAERLRIKECDRLAAMAETLTALGADIEERADGLLIHGKAALHGGVTVSGWNDHRVVMALAMAACFCEAPVCISGAEAVRKSYPDFFAALRALGGVIDGI